MLPTLVSSEYEVKLFTLALSLSFAGFLRLSEFTSVSRTDANPPLAKSDLSLLRDKSAVVLRIRRSKTNQSGRPEFLSLDANPAMGPLCPVSAAASYFAVRPAAAHALLAHFNGSALTRNEFPNLLR